MKTHVKVFVTKTNKFRANVTEITEDCTMQTEVTVGGSEWYKGKLKRYHSEIIGKCNKLAQGLIMELISVED